MLRSVGTLILLLATLVAAGACENDPSGLEVVEEYVLAAVNGEPPPRVIFENEAGQLLMVEGQMALFDNGSYIQQINFEQVFDGETVVRTSRICRGTYTLDPTELVLTEDECDERVYRATRSADTISYQFSEGIHVTWRIDPAS